MPNSTLYKKFLRSSTAKYVTVGILVYGIEVGVIVAAQYAGSNSLVAVGLSYWIGYAISFSLQKFVTFGDRRTHHKILLPQLLAVTALVLFNFAFTILCTKLLQKSFPVALIRAAAIGVTTLWNYYLYKNKIFKNAGLPPID